MVIFLKRLTKLEPNSIHVNFSNIATKFEPLRKITVQYHKNIISIYSGTESSFYKGGEEYTQEPALQNSTREHYLPRTALTAITVSITTKGVSCALNTAYSVSGQYNFYFSVLFLGSKL